MLGVLLALIPVETSTYADFTGDIIIIGVGSFSVCHFESWVDQYRE